VLWLPGRFETLSSLGEIVKLEPDGTVLK